MEVYQLLIGSEKFKSGTGIDQLQACNLPDVVILQKQIISLDQVIACLEDRRWLEFRDCLAGAALAVTSQFIILHTRVVNI